MALSWISTQQPPSRNPRSPPPNILVVTLEHASSVSPLVVALSLLPNVCADVRPTYTCITSPRYGVMHNGGLPLDGAADCLTSLLDAGKVLVINSNSSSTSEVG